MKFLNSFRIWDLWWMIYIYIYILRNHQRRIIPRVTRWVDGTPTTEVTRSLSGRSIHLTLVTKWSWSWSWMTYYHSLCARYSYFKIRPWKSMVKVMCVVKGQGHVWPSKFKGQGYGQGQTHWSHLRHGVQSICLLFVSWQSDLFWLKYRKYLTLKIQGHGHDQCQTWWSHLRPLSSIAMFAFRFVAIGPF